MSTAAARSCGRVELQGVHVIDTCNWILGAHPVKASGTGGRKGISESHYTGGVFIQGEQAWDSGVARGTREEITSKDWGVGSFKSALEDADPNKQKAFIDSIQSGKFINEADVGAESTLSAILGTMAAYRGEEITWDEMMATDEQWDPMIDLFPFDR